MRLRVGRANQIADNPGTVGDGGSRLDWTLA